MFMWKRFRKFVLNLIRLFSFKKRKKDSKLLNEHEAKTLLKYTSSESDWNYINSNISLNASEEDDDKFYDALSEEDWKKQHAEKEKKVYENDKLYSVNDLQEVTEFTGHENTFATAIFEYSVDGQSKNNNDSYQLIGLELNTNEESKACTLNLQGKQSNIKISSDHLRLYMPFFFADKKQKSIDELFQYEKNGTTSMPSVVLLLEKPDNINLNPDFGSSFISNKIWQMIKDSETRESTKITKALFPTFAVELEGQNINFSVNKDAIPQSMEALKDEKPAIRAILAIPGISSLVAGIISNILNKITSEVEKTSFRIKDVLISGRVINELQVQNSIVKEDECCGITSEDEFFDALEVQEDEQNIKQNKGSELSDASISCMSSLHR